MKSVPSPEHSVPIKTLTLSCLKSMPSSGTANEPMATIFNQELFVLTAILCFKMEPTLRNRASRSPSPSSQTILIWKRGKHLITNMAEHSNKMAGEDSKDMMQFLSKVNDVGENNCNIQLSIYYLGESL